MTSSVGSSTRVGLAETISDILMKWIVVSDTCHAGHLIHCHQ